MCAHVYVHEHAQAQTDKHMDILHSMHTLAQARNHVHLHRHTLTHMQIAHA